MGISYIQHKGKKIMFCDYSQCKTKEETIQVLGMAREEYLKTDESFLVLNDFSGGVVSNEFMEKAKQYGKELFDARTPKTASIGISGMKKVFISTYNLFVKNKLSIFETKAEALDFLVK
ncbi:MAG: hypothetical protein JW798_06060 [Prolixibacteraceae bacterium]|nr:hypothetical protein [Prolixibacteraceae bacterium]